MRLKYSGTWTFGVCESCLKNSHERVEMVKEDNMWICPLCASTKRL